jgi:hypothetical protein
MPIVSITTETFVQRCAACGRDNELAVADLELGVAMGDAVNANIIALPACQCGANEFLHRTWDTVPDAHATTPFAAQRRAVNGLAEHLKRTGRSHARVKAAHQAERAVPPEVDRLTPTRMRVALPLGLPGDPPTEEPPAEPAEFTSSPIK